MNEEEKRTRPLERFGWFAASHVLISILTLLLFVVYMLLSMTAEMGLPGIFFLVVLEMLALAGYWGAGAYLARRRQWTAFSNPKEFWGAMLRPAVIAWIWGGVVLVIFFWIGVYLPEDAAAAILSSAGAIMAWVSVVLCAPSSLMVLLFFALGISQNLLSWSMAVMLLLAGGLPPLLFTLGSAWGSAGERKTRKGPLLTGAALVVVLGLLLTVGIGSGQGIGFGPGTQDWRYVLTGGYQLMRVNTCTIVLTKEDGEIVVDGYVSAFADTGKDIFVRGVPEPLEDPDDRPEMEECLWYWIDTEKHARYGPYQSAGALEEAADAQGVYVPDPESWTETYPAPSGARYD